MSSTKGATVGISDVCKTAYGGKVRENVAHYSQHFSKTGEREEDFDYESRTEKTGEIAQSFYTLVTDFYEYGYGPSFHFAPVQDAQSLEECLLHYEQEIARTLKARPGRRILVSLRRFIQWWVKSMQGI